MKKTRECSRDECNPRAGAVADASSLAQAVPEATRRRGGLCLRSHGMTATRVDELAGGGRRGGVRVPKGRGRTNG